MLASKFQARWRTCPPIFGHSEFCVRRISRLLFRHDSIVIAYTRIFCKVPSSAWSSKKTKKTLFATHREYTSRWIESRNFCINKSNYSMTKSISHLGIFGKVALYFVRKKWCAYRDVRTSIHPGSSRVHTRFDDIMSLLFSDTMNA